MLLRLRVDFGYVIQNQILKRMTPKNQELQFILGQKLISLDHTAPLLTIE